MAAINLPLPQPRKASPGRSPLGMVNGWVLAGMAVLGISAMLPVLQNSAATSRGFQIQDIEAQKAKLNGQVRQMEAEVAQLTSLTRIQRRAGEIGLAPGNKPIYVTVTEPGPAPAKLPAQYLPGPDQSQDGSEAWWQSASPWGQPPAR